MPHLTLYDQLGDMPISILGAIVGRGMDRSRLAVGRRGPESSPKVSLMTKCTCGGLCSKWILPKNGT